MDLNRLTHFLEQFFDCGIQGPPTQASGVIFVADHTIGIDQEYRRPSFNFPITRYGTCSAGSTIPKAAPGYGAIGHQSFWNLAVRVAIDADQRKWFPGKLFNERPLVRIHFHTRRSPMTPEIEHDNFASVVAQPKRITVDILANDVHGRFSHAQMPQHL